MKMTTYYAGKLQSGFEFQDFVAIEFAKIGIPITNFSSKKLQSKIGENLQGYEIKNDEMFRRTGNLWIETHEKTESMRNNGIEYFESGILRADNTKFYVIGDYLGVFLIQKKVLKKMHEKGKYRKLENNMKTSRGFLLPTADAIEYFDYIEFLTDPQKI